MSDLAMLYDGGCGLCRRSVRWLKERDPAGRLAFEDITKAGVLDRYGVSEERAMGRLQAFARDGGHFEGADAVLKALSFLPRWWLLGRLASYPPAIWLARPIYDYIARRRQRATCGDGSCSLAAHSGAHNPGQVGS